MPYLATRRMDYLGESYQPDDVLKTDQPKRAVVAMGWVKYVEVDALTDEQREQWEAVVSPDEVREPGETQESDGEPAGEGTTATAESDPTPGEDTPDGTSSEDTTEEPTEDSTEEPTEEPTDGADATEDAPAEETAEEEPAQPKGVEVVARLNADNEETGWFDVMKDGEPVNTKALREDDAKALAKETKAGS